MFDPALTLVIALAFGVIAQAGARHLRVPAIVLLLGSGVVLGPDLLGWVQPQALGAGLFHLVHLAVAVILFEGGLRLEVSRLRREQQAIRRLITLGAAITLLGGGFAAGWLLGWSPRLALLFGSLVVVTGPTVVGPLISELRLRPRIAGLLEAEGVLIDPVGAILAVLALDIVLAPGVEAIGSGATGLLLRVAYGGAAGVIGGLTIALLLRRRNLVPQGLENILTFSLVLLLFEVCEHFADESGLLAVTLAGVVVGNIPSRADRDLREFKDQLTLLFIGLLFVLLAAGVRLDDIRALGVEGALVVLALIMVVRPVSVLVSTLGTGLSWRERVFASWVAPRGIVAAAVASTAAAALDHHGMAGGVELRALVFLTIAGTVVQAGVGALPMAMLLKLRLPGRERVAILGAKGLGLHLGLELKRADVDVVLIDANPQNCRRAQEQGLPVVFGNAIADRTLQRARIESVGTVIGITSNDELNGLFVTRARELFSVPEGWVALSRSDAGLSADVVRDSNARVLFEGPHDVGRWDVRDRHDELLIEYRAYTPPDGEPVALERPGERFVFLCVRRGKRTFPMYAACEPREGDLAAVAIHAPDRERVDQELRAAGWEQAPDAA